MRRAFYVYVSLPLLFLLIATMSVLAQPHANVVGTWQVRTAQGAFKLVLNQDGTGNVNGKVVRWQFNQGHLALSGQDGTLEMFEVSLTPDTLTMAGASLPQPVTFQRVGTGASASGSKAEGGTPGRSGLVGQWQGPDGLVQIHDTGTMVIAGQTYRYTVQGNIITVLATDGAVQIPYQLNGDTLMVLVNGQQQTLRRVGASAAPGQLSKTGSVAMELIGQWCYFASMTAQAGGGRMTNECFTLHPNGTYEYHNETSASAYAPGISGGTASQGADSGTWSATAATITAHSRTQGTTTYTLEKRNHPKNGDPMLCLDGKCFVTAAQRPPWR